MSGLKNNVQLIGNLGNNPDIKSLENGKKIAKFSIAVNESYKSQEGEKVVNTSWFSLIAWGKMADLVELLLIKGSEVAISGKLSTSSYEDKDGNQRYITEVVVNEFLLLSGGNPKNIIVDEEK
jgi:single-strand DNA-binding protein